MGGDRRRGRGSGGAQITVTEAMESGITVFAVPGDIGRETLVATNLLIRDGVHPVLDPEDSVEELALVVVLPAAVGEEATVG